MPSYNSFSSVIDNCSFSFFFRYLFFIHNKNVMDPVQRSLYHSAIVGKPASYLLLFRGHPSSRKSFLSGSECINRFSRHFEEEGGSPLTLFDDLWRKGTWAFFRDFAEDGGMRFTLEGAYLFLRSLVLLTYLQIICLSLPGVHKRLILEQSERIMEEYELDFHITLNNDNYGDNISKVDVIAYPSKHLQWHDDTKQCQKDAK